MQSQGKELTKEEIKQRNKEAERFNRQINFLVMREMWQAIRKRAKRHSGNTIYKAFDMSRTQYNAAIDGGNIRLSEEKIKYLVTETGVRREIFEGKDCFKFKKIERAEWQKLFELKGKRDENENKVARSEWEPEQKRILSKINADDVDEVNNPDFYQFAVYLKAGKEVGDTAAERKIKNGIKLLSDIKLSDCENCQFATLQDFVEILNRQVDIAGTVLRYSELKKKKTE